MREPQGRANENESVFSGGIVMKEFYITDDGIRLHAKLEMPEGKHR